MNYFHWPLSNPKNTVKRLWWCFFVEIINGSRPLTIFTKKIHHISLIQFQICRSNPNKITSVLNKWFKIFIWRLFIAVTLSFTHRSPTHPFVTLSPLSPSLWEEIPLKTLKDAKNTTTKQVQSEVSVGGVGKWLYMTWPKKNAFITFFS